MTDEEYVKSVHRDARVVKAGLRFRIKVSEPVWSLTGLPQRTYLCNWVGTEGRAWRAARQSLITRSLDRMDE